VADDEPTAKAEGVMFLSRNASKDREENDLGAFFLHLVAGDRRIALGPLERLGGGRGGILVRLKTKSGAARVVGIGLTDHGAVVYNGQEFADWFIDTAGRTHSQETIEVPRVNHSLGIKGWD